MYTEGSFYEKLVRFWLPQILFSTANEIVKSCKFNFTGFLQRTVARARNMPKPTDNIEVLREDQEKINKFSRLNGQLSEVEQMIESRTKIVKVKTAFFIMVRDADWQFPF